MNVSTANQGVSSYRQEAHSLDSIRNLATRDHDAALEAVAQQFEGLFIQMMMKSMRQTVGEGSLFDSQAVKTFREMQDGEWAKRIAASGGLGLADQIVRSLAPKNADGEEIETVKRSSGGGENGPAMDTQDYLQRRLSPEVER